MKAKKLIELLSELPSDADVYVHSYSKWTYNHVIDTRVITVPHNSCSHPNIAWCDNKNTSPITIIIIQ